MLATLRSTMVAVGIVVSLVGLNVAKGGDGQS
jgi:hypothetical protein